MRKCMLPSVARCFLVCWVMVFQTRRSLPWTCCKASIYTMRLSITSWPLSKQYSKRWITCTHVLEPSARVRHCSRPSQQIRSSPITSKPTRSRVFVRAYAVLKRATRCATDPLQTSVKSTASNDCGTIGDAVHVSIGALYVLLGTVGEEAIGRVFGNEDVKTIYG